MRGIGPKSTDSLLSLDPEQIDVVLTHPDQVAVCGRIYQMTTWLRDCETVDDLYALQTDLVSHLLTAQQRRSECTGAANRLLRNRAVGDITPFPDGRNQDTAEAWLLEAYVFARLERQIRSVGDALAWALFEFDRRVILALSQNQSPGPMVGKKGLGWELGHVKQFREDTGQFALLHDITNCLRIADVTEFHSDGRLRFTEVKAGGRSRPTQNRRADQAVAALNGNAPLPGRPDTGLLRLKTKHATDLDRLSDLFRVAGAEGCRSLVLEGGRALRAMNMPVLLGSVDDEPMRAADLMRAERDSSLQHAQFAGSTRLVQASSFDKAARSAIQVPYAVYPLDPQVIANLVCDFVGFDTVVSVDALVQVFQERGYGADVVAPLALGTETGAQMETDEPVLRVWNGTHTLTVRQQALSPLLYELLEPGAWASGITELLDGLHENAPANPVLVYADEAQTWR
jgi:hypothetical protein